MDNRLALVRTSSWIRAFVIIGLFLCIMLRVVLFVCSVNMLFNMEDIDLLRQTYLFQSKLLDAQANRFNNPNHDRRQAPAQSQNQLAGSQGPATQY